MNFTFKISTIATFSNPQPKKATKRKTNAAASLQDEQAVKKQKLSDDSPFYAATDDLTPACLNTVFVHDERMTSISSTTTRSSTPASTSSEGRKQAGFLRSRTSTPKLSTRNLKRSTMLRQNHPVRTNLPQDVWINIFKHCKPETLFKARALARGFNETISFDSVWKQSLIEEFGPSLPDPPEGLSYMNYANLLTRYGCQACKEAKPGRGKARRTYWAFQRRYCEKCLDEKIIYEKQLRQWLRYTDVHPHIDRMMECLPQAKYDSWAHYQWVGTYAETPIWATKYPNTQKIGFLEPDMKKLKAEVEAFLTTSPTEEELNAWFDLKITINKVLVSQLQAVEDFCERRRIAKLDDSISSRDIRKDFFQEKAALMDRPMELKMLEKCESYQRATRISRPPVNLERSWLALQPKLEREREEIEERWAKIKRDEEEFRMKYYSSYAPFDMGTV